MFLHDFEEFHDDLGDWTDQNLSLAAFLGVGDSLKTIGEDGHLHLRYQTQVIKVEK